MVGQVAGSWDGTGSNDESTPDPSPSASQLRRLLHWLTGTSRRWAIAGFVVLLYVVLGSIERVLGDMHLPGSDRTTITKIASPVRVTSPDEGLALLQVWDDWDASTALTQQHEVGPWAFWWLGVDVVFALGLGLLVGIVRKRCYGRCDRDRRFWLAVHTPWHRWHHIECKVDRACDHRDSDCAFVHRLPRS
jgi:hypothetical protein